MDMKKKSRLLKKIAENGISDDTLYSILNNMKFETESDDEIGIKVIGTISIDNLPDNIEPNQLVNVLKTDSYVVDYFKEVAEESKSNGIESFVMPKLNVSFDGNKIEVVADIDEIKHKQEDISMYDNLSNDYHNTQDFL